MNEAVSRMLGKYKCTSGSDYKNALIEIMQEVALLGLWRAKYFEHAAFYGGTALRILYGLNRFSEDLDFSLLKPQPKFDLSPYLTAVECELNGMGFNVSVETRKKKVKTATESAFIKAGTKESLLKINVPKEISDRLPHNSVLEIKLEVDTDPPAGFQTEAKTLMQPIPFAVNTFTPPDLFAGKLHAILQRKWKTRVKGRDYYDFVWYITQNIPVRLSHLEKRLLQTGGWTGEGALRLESLNGLLKSKFTDLIVESAKQDVLPFVRDTDSVELWSPEFFISLLPKLKAI
ncbi:MAG: nucleotidyl transferase AbiEii/AbiGii toxin family protein [Deltaproteobacteria bacterium]|nr:nucleotidyl transferase AbiEii/AbiGii toxin family protein [Deltaproteobacteria bacterium]